MENAIVVKATNVVDLSEKVLFLDIKDIKPAYSDKALVYTSKLVDALFEYNHDHTQSHLNHLISSTKKLVAIVKPSVLKNISTRKSLTREVNSWEFSNTYH